MKRNLFGVFKPITMVFKDDNSADTGGAVGSDSTNSSDDSEAADAKQAQSNQTFELKIGNSTRTVTLDEMRDLATKSAGADAAFRTASDMKKEAERGLRIQTLSKSIIDDENPSEADIQEFSSLLGLDPKEFLQYMGDSKEPAQKQTRSTSAEVVTKEAVAAALKQLGLDVEDAKGTLSFSKQRHIDSARQQIREFSDQAVEKDKVFGKMIVGDDGKNREEVIKEMVSEEVLRKIQDGERFGAEMVASCIQKVRTQLTRFGIPNKPDLYPITLGQGPGSGLPVDIQSDEPIKRIPAGEDKADDNIVSRWMQKAYQKIKSGR